MAGTTTTADVRLKVGATSQSVEVRALAPLIEQTSSNFTTAVETHYIQDLALPGRDIQGLVQLVPGITQSARPGGAIFRFRRPLRGFSDSARIIGSWINANRRRSSAERR